MDMCWAMWNTNRGNSDKHVYFLYWLSIWNLKWSKWNVEDSMVMQTVKPCLNYSAENKLYWTQVWSFYLYCSMWHFNRIWKVLSSLTWPTLQCRNLMFSLWYEASKYIHISLELGCYKIMLTQVQFMVYRHCLLDFLFILLFLFLL